MRARVSFFLVRSVWFSGQAFAEPAKLTVHVDRPGPRISPTLYGIFFEEINLAGDGGLYAELLRNRSFEDADKPDHWSLSAHDVESTAKVIVLSAANPTHENSLTEPTKVTPVWQTIDGAAANFHHSFPANSATILRLMAR